MKNLKLLIWITQLGLSVVSPLACFIFLALWLRNNCGWGEWTLWVGIILGIVGAIDGLRTSLKIMHRTAEKDTQKPPVSFNEHD